MFQIWKWLKDGNKLCWVMLGRWGWPNDSWRLSTDGPRSTVSLSSNHYYQQETKRWRSRLPLAGTVTLGQKCSCYNTDGLPAKHDLPCVSDRALPKIKSNREQMYRRIHSPYWKGVFKNKLTFYSIGLPSKKIHITRKNA